MARCLPLTALDDTPVGGKARGLARLLAAGLRVPAGFVIVDAASGALDEAVEKAYAALGSGPVAVRSSALDEDGAQASFAGQYETVLSVEGSEALAAAIDRCLASFNSERAQQYRREQAGAGDSRMCVVVQRMVPATVAGVLFSVDPVTGRRDRLVVDAVRGLGEALVSGEATPDHYELDCHGRVAFQTLAAGQPLLDDGQLRELAQQARDAEAKLGEPLDMEWAIDDDRQLHWLQARPITTLGSDPNELDTPLPAPDDVLTRCNIGEMMPGAVTPLTWAMTGRGIDHGMQALMKRSGALRDIQLEPPRTVAMRYGQLFLDLTQMAVIARHVAGATVEDLCLSVCGRVVPEVDPGPPSSGPRRALNGLRYAFALFEARNHAAPMQQRLDELAFDTKHDARSLQRSIEGNTHVLFEAYDHHLLSSAISGALAPALLQTLSKGEPPTEAHHAQLARLLAGAEGVESADIASGMDELIRTVFQQPGAREHLLASSPEAARDWLEGAASGRAGERYRAYLAQHGHRAVRELELRQPEWAHEPAPLIQSLLVALRADAPGRTAGQHETVQVPRGLGMLVRLAKSGVRKRERTKSLLVATTTAFKRAYRTLGDKLVAEGRLPDPDLVFFLLPRELDRLIDGEDALADTAAQRRRALPQQTGMALPDVCVGNPEPLREVAATDGDIVGRPVSCGRVTGPVRVVHSLEEAAALEPGEILVARITDAGWTPYFGMLGGLITDLGSAVSHGAVVAREYGLPCVVDARHASRSLRTGEWVTLDGDRGTVERVAGPGTPHGQPVETFV